MEQLTLEELKALAYDTIVRLEQTQASLKQINDLIAKKSQERLAEIEKSKSKKKAKK